MIIWLATLAARMRTQRAFMLMAETLRVFVDSG
jgi:hypothetical protein